MRADALKPRREQLEDLDIKTIVEYVVGETTHVVTSKRNTAKGLQALVNGKYIVNNSYIEALVYAGTSEDLAEPDSNLCPLEKDFDAAWPDPTKHLPPSGKEIIDLPAASSDNYFRPESNRQNIFEDFTFVFCSKDQYENLSPVITNGHGKSLLYPMENGKTTADELEQYMRNAAGRKGFGDVDTQQQGGGVILVRWVVKGEMQKWADELADEVSLRIDQRPIDQGDFLNIVLNNVPGLLRRSCGVASPAAESVAEPPSSSLRPIKPPQSSPPAPAPMHDSSPSPAPDTRRRDPPNDLEQPPAKRQRTHGVIKSRFKTFDDGFDIEIDSVPSYQEENPESIAPSEAAVPEASQIDSYAPSQNEDGSASSDDDRRMDDLFPAAAAMKKQRLEMQRKGKENKKASQGDALQHVKKVKKAEDFDVIEAARKRREAEEEAIRMDQEALEHANIDVENIRNLAVVVEMDLPVRTYRPGQSNGEGIDRWDERWNGRKNFKRFRRHGEGTGRIRLAQKVIVPLEEAKKASYGIGPGYWPDSSRSSRRDTQPSNTSQSQVRNTTVATQSTSVERTSPEATKLQQEAEDIVGVIDVDEPRHTRADDQGSSTRSQPQTQGGKRSATDQGTLASKRQKTLRMRGDDDSDDELKFRFGRRKK